MLPKAPKPPLYPATKPSDCTRTQMRRLPTLQHESGQRDRGSSDVSPSCRPIQLFCRKYFSIKRVLPRSRKINYGTIVHVSIVAFVLLLLAAACSLFVAEDLHIATIQMGGSGKTSEKEAVLRSLHEHFSVPMYLLHRMEEPRGKTHKEFQVHRSAEEQLLSLLLARSDSGDPQESIQYGQVHVPGIPRVLFATIDGSTIGERVRAVASAISYASNTGRIPVLFWGIHEQRWNVSWQDTFFNATRLRENIIIVDHLLEELAAFSAALTGSEESADTPERGTDDEIAAAENISSEDDAIDSEPPHDWAEFSVIDVTQAAVPSDAIPREQTQEDDMNKQHNVKLLGSGDEEQKILTRDDIRTLDTAAAVDAHITISVHDEVVSRYAPRFQTSMVANSGLLSCVGQLETEASAAYAFEYALNRMSDESILRRLHDYFDIPFMILEGMRQEMRLLLLRQLVAKEAAGIRAPRTIIIHVQYGLGNRLRALGSAMAFAKETNRVVVLVWEPDHHLNCEFRDLFVEQDDVVVSDKFVTTELWPFTASRSKDPSAQRVVWYNYMRVNGEHVHDPSELVLDEKDAHIYISTAYVVQSLVTPYIIRTQSPFWAILKSLTPHITVARLVEKLSQMPMEKMMGVHIRSKLIKADISGVGAEEYTKASSTRTDYWRSLTQVESFLNEMKRQPSSQLFYVAADQIDVLEQLQAAFPSRIYYIPRQCEGRDRECLPYALADILLLAKCPSIRGSYWSSFSEIAIRIGGGRVLLAGIDFGRPSLDKPKSKVKTSGTRKSALVLRKRPRWRRRRSSAGRPSTNQTAAVHTKR